MGALEVLIRTLINLRIWRPPIEPVPVTRSERLDAFIRISGILGYIGRGLLWLSIGVVALNAAVNLTEPEGPTGAIAFIADETGGLVVLILALVGIFAYSLWRFTEGSLGLAVDPTAGRARQVLIGYIVPFGSALGYLAIGAIIIHDIDESRSTFSTSSVTESLATNAGGQILFTLAAVILAAVAVGFLVTIGTGNFKRAFDQERLFFDDIMWSAHFGGQPASKLFYSLAYIGTVGRSLLFFLTSVLVFRIAFDDSVEKDTSPGFGEALSQLTGSLAGRIFLGSIGVLLIIFGIYSFFIARYRRFLYYRPRTLALVEGDHWQGKLRRDYIDWFTKKTELFRLIRELFRRPPGTLPTLIAGA